MSRDGALGTKSLRKLINRGALVNKTDAQGRTPLQLAWKPELRRPESISRRAMTKSTHYSFGELLSDPGLLEVASFVNRQRGGIDVLLRSGVHLRRS
jgi:hypothetical protein